MTPILFVLFVVAVAAGGAAAAIALVALPHAVATGVRAWRLRTHVDWLVLRRFGVLSGIGGVAGNQGGLRAAALGTFPRTPAAFVATSTAVGVIVDAARVPLYLMRAGKRVLLSLPRERFRTVLALAVGGLGVWLLGSTVR